MDNYEEEASSKDRNWNCVVVVLGRRAERCWSGCRGVLE